MGGEGIKTYRVEVAFAPVLDAGEDWAELGVVMARTGEEAIKRASLSDRIMGGAFFRVTELDTRHPSIITLSDMGHSSPTQRGFS